MSFADYIKSAWKNEKSGGGRGKSLTILIFLGLYLFLTMNSITDSVGKAVDRVIDIPAGRTLIANDNNKGEIYEKMREEMKEENRIEEVYRYVSGQSIQVSDIREGAMVYLTAQTYPQAMQEYLCDREKPEEGEILLPKYMYGFNDEQYLDGGKFVGKTVTVRVTDYNEKETEFSFLVSGTYDNVYAVTGNDTVFLAQEDAIKIMETAGEGKKSKMLQDMKDSGDYDATHYFGYENQYRCAVVVKNTEDISEIQEKYADLKLHTQADTMHNTIKETFEILRLCANGIMLLLFITALVDIMIMTVHDIRKRKWEMALYQVQGYTKGQITGMLLLEYCGKILRGIAVALILCILTIITGNWLITHKLSMEFSMIHLKFAMCYFWYSIALAGILLTGGLYRIHSELGKMDLINILKGE